MENYTKKCPHCQKDIDQNAKKCPHCQSDLRSWWVRHPIFTVFIIISVIGLISMMSNSGSSTNNNSQTTDQTQQAQTTSVCPTSDITTLKTNAKTINFKELDKDSNSFNGQVAIFTGQIVQIQESDGQGIIRLAVTPTSYGWSSSDIIYINYQGHIDALQDDVVTIYGVMTGSYTYTSQANYKITLPSMTECNYIKGYPKSKSVSKSTETSSNTSAITSTQTQTNTDWTTYTSLPANFLKNPPYYIGTKVKLTGTVTDFLASGDRGGDTNYISIISTDPAAPSQQFMLEIDSSANYQKIVSSVNKLNAVIAYGTIEKTTSFTKYSTNGTVIVPVVNIARLDACTSLLICTSDDKTLQTIFPTGITQTSVQNSQTAVTTPTLPPLIAFKGKLNDILPGIQFFVGTPQEYTSSDSYSQPATGNKFVSVYIQITNQSNIQVNYNPMDFKIVDPTGSQYSESFTGQLDPVLNYGTLNSGENVSGNIVYEVPASASASQFNIHYDSYIDSTHVVTDFK